MESDEQPSQPSPNPSSATPTSAVEELDLGTEIISAIPVVQQLPAISLSGNNAQRTLWIGDVPSDWTEDTLTQIFTVSLGINQAFLNKTVTFQESKHPPYKVKRVYVKEEV